MLLALQYRMDFFVDVLLEVISTSSAIIPLWVVFADRRAVAGVSFEEALVVAGVFTILQGVVEAAVMPSLASIVEHVRTGTLDFVLLLPADAQLLVSTSRFLPWRFVNVVTGTAIVAVGMTRQHVPLEATRLALAALFFACGVVILYAVLLLAVTASFFAVRVDNLAYLMTSVLDAGRWPVRVFRGALRWIFTFVFPLAVMTSFPAGALLGAATTSTVVTALLLAVAFAAGSRAFFRFALRRYASASS
jgi:ABC-2 type transport system permease protein